MEYVVDICKDLRKEVRVSLSPLMLDGIGLCGACRVLINGEIKFACIDGPEFDGTLVDFDTAKKRMELFKTEEGRRYLKVTEGDKFTGGIK
jgi:ferredoxin--NADP+ reductase